MLGPERALAAAPGVRRSFFDRNRWLIELALALAAVTVGAVGFLALRRKA
jgi:hypothetical protein